MASKAATVLVVDDDSETQMLLRTTLNVQGHNVLTASNGREALAVLQESEVDAIVLDMQMPVMGGLETIEQIRANPATHVIPVMIVSGMTWEEEKVTAAMKLGANDYISKPYNPALLVQRIGVMVDLHRLHRERSKAVREMAGATSHELSQPLTSLLGHLEMLMAKLAEIPKDLAQTLVQAHRAAMDVAAVLKRIQKVDEHRTISYVENDRIVDLSDEPRPENVTPFNEEYQRAIREIPEEEQT